MTSYYLLNLVSDWVCLKDNFVKLVTPQITDSALCEPASRIDNMLIEEWSKMYEEKLENSILTNLVAQTWKHQNNNLTTSKIERNATGANK